MKKTLHFSVQSPQNFSRLCATIFFEKSEHFKEYGYLWENVFNKDDDFGDRVFYEFLTELFPNGTTLDEEELKKLTERAFRYLKEDSKCQELHIEHLKETYPSWVYSKYNKKLIPVGFAMHEAAIKTCCMEYFNDVKDDIDEEKVKKFILSNFEIRSANSTVSKIAADSRYIFNCIVFGE